jgi:glucosamine kinase
VRKALERAGVAERVVVRADGETALHGAFAGGPGILLIAGTGSVGWGRGEDGRVEHCGGWGMTLGDEGSGFGLARAGLVAALRGHDGRGPATPLLATFLRELGLHSAHDLPPWVGRASKSEIAALAVHVVRAAESDEVAGRVVREGAVGLAEHAGALIERLAPWTSAPGVVLHGGLARNATFAGAVRAAFAQLPTPPEIRQAAADAVSGAVRLARLAAHTLVDH